MKQYRDTPYYITQDGKIYRNGREIFGWITKKGYRQITIYFNGDKRKEYVHRLVGELYLDNPDNKPQINHKNGNKLDNRSENLECVTNKENRAHALENGLQCIGEDMYNHKFTEDDIIWIRTNYKFGDNRFGCNGIADYFNGLGYNTNTSRIWKIVNRKTWKHL